MRAIEVDDDIYNYLLQYTETIGESASSILRRRLIGFTSAPNTGVTTSNGQAVTAPDLEQEFLAFLRSPVFLQSRVKTKRFLRILSFAYRQKPESFERLLSIPPRRHRVIFARSREEIEASGKSTDPQPIPDSPYWVSTNSDTPQKREELRTALLTLGYSRSIIEEALGTIA